MTRPQFVELFEKRQVLWEARDAVALSSIHADTGTIVSPIFGTVRGRDAIVKSYHDLFQVFADWSFQNQELIVDGDMVAQVFRVQATHTQEFFGAPATHRRLDISGVLVFHFDGDRALHERRFYDFTGLLIQIGVLKAKPP